MGEECLVGMVSDLVLSVFQPAGVLKTRFVRHSRLPERCRLRLWPGATIWVSCSLLWR